MKTKVADLPKPQEKIFKDFHAETKADEGAGKRVLVAKISTPNTDRSKDHVMANGAIIDNFMKNPVVQFAHKYDELPIAKCTALKISDDGILATVEFPEEGKYDKSDVIYWMYKNGYLNAWSIGFMPTKDGYEANEEGGYDFTRWELFEFSSVPVPDNPEALTVIRSKGINVDLVVEKKDAPAKEEEETKDPEKTVEPVEGKEADDTKQALDQANETIKTLQAEIEELKGMLEAKATEDTLVSELSAKQLKELFIPPAVEQKDVSQVTSLAYVLSDLQWLAYMFEYDEVSQETIDKINQAIALLLEAIKDQAELGKKEVAISNEAFDKLTAEQKELVRTSLAKAGRTISGKHEEMLKAACDHMEKAAEQVNAVLGSVASQDDTEGDDNDGDEKSIDVDITATDFIVKFANRLKDHSKKQDAIIREVKEQQKDSSEILHLLEQIESKEGGE